MRIAVLSDTHGLLRPEVLRVVHTCSYIFHAGDITRPEVLDALQKAAPLFAVRGNNDRGWAAGLPQSLYVTLGGVRFFMVHDRRDAPAEPDGAQVAVFGHSHRYAQFELAGRLWLNPGSCGPKRFNLPVTMAVIDVQDRHCRVERIDLIPGTAPHPPGEYSESGSLI